MALCNRPNRQNEGKSCHIQHVCTCIFNSQTTRQYWRSTRECLHGLLFSRKVVKHCMIKYTCELTISNCVWIVVEQSLKLILLYVFS